MLAGMQRRRPWTLGAAMLCLVTAACRDAPVPVALQGARRGDAVTRHADAPEARLADATRLLSLDRRAEEASAAFRSLADDATVAAPLRERARLGAARAERLLGRRDAAAELLRETLSRSADLPDVREEAQSELTSLDAARTRYFLATAGLDDGQYLDLDTGGVLSVPETPQGGRAEVQRRGDDLLWLVPHELAPEAAEWVPWLADTPWWSCLTDAGRSAWVQRAPGDDPGALRFLLRVSGTAEGLPSPRGLAGVGGGGSVEVTFEPDPLYARWRVERRSGPDGAFEVRGEVDGPPFVDTDVVAGRRYGYRVTGVTAAGDEGVPGVVQATTRSRGVVRGTVELVGGRGNVGFDALREAVVARGGDIAFHASDDSGSSVGLLDAFGRVVRAAPGSEPPRTPWGVAPTTARQSEVGAGAWVVVPVRGGGVMRCRVLPQGGWKLRLEYEVDPDRDAFGEPPRIEAVPDGPHVEVRVAAVPRGYEVDVVTAVRASGRRCDLPVVDGRALDRDPGPEPLLTYEASAVDRHGRRTPRAVVRLDRRPDEPVSGTFQFHYRQGWSFERGEVCAADEADVYFASCAGGLSSVTFTAPGGILSLEHVTGTDGLSPSPGRLVEGVLGVAPEAARLRSEARGDSRTPESDVFVLRLPNGGWARMAIVERVTTGYWQERPVTVAFTWNPRAPRFGDPTPDATLVSGLLLAPEAVPNRLSSRRGAAAPTAREPGGQVVVVGAGGRTREPSELRGGAGGAGGAGGSVHVLASSQEVLLALARFRDVEKATYRLATGRRDELRQGAGHLSGELRYGSAGDVLEVGRPDVLLDLGERTWEEVTAEGESFVPVPVGPARRAVASYGRVYSVTEGGASPVPALVRVTGLVPGERVAFEVATLDGARLRTSPGFDPSPELRAALVRVLAAARERMRGGFVGELPATSAAGMLWARLEERTSIGDSGVPLRQALVVVGPFEVDPSAEVACDTVHVRHETTEPTSLAEFLDVVTRQAGVAWTVTEGGAVRIVPVPRND
jgi:hypothetical protein